MPTEVTSLAGTVAVSCVELLNVVASAVPFHRTEEDEVKSVPVAIRGKAVWPTTAEVGESDVSTGVGLPTVKVTAVEIPPPGEGLTTVIGIVPFVVTSLVLIAAVNWVLVTNEVLLLDPFH